MYQKLTDEKNVYIYHKMGLVLTQSVCQVQNPKKFSVGKNFGIVWLVL